MITTTCALADRKTHKVRQTYTHMHTQTTEVFVRTLKRITNPIQYCTGDRDRSGYNRTDSSRPEYSGNRDHFNHHGQDRAGTERGDRPHPTRGTERGDYQRCVRTCFLSLPFHVCFVCIKSVFGRYYSLSTCLRPFLFTRSR